LTRVSTRQAEEQQLQVSIAQMQRELTSRYAAAPSGGTTSAAEQQMQMSTQQAAIAQLGAVKPTGRIVLDMRPSASTISDIPNFPLEDGDSFYIPPRLSTVQVAGAVYNENAFRYQPRKHLSAYLNDAGGPPGKPTQGASFWSGRTEPSSAGKATASSGIPTLKARSFCPGTRSSSPPN